MAGSIEVGSVDLISTDGLHKTSISANPTADRVITLLDESFTIAPTDSPALTGTPTAPTAIAGTNTTQIATTAFVKAKSEADSIGVGQTWQDVTASRANNTTYTNNTGKPIVVTIRSNYTVNCGVEIVVNGVSNSVQTISTAGGTVSTSAIVPNGATYSNGSTWSGFLRWSELR